jgi:hypothetical protein
MKLMVSLKRPSPEMVLEGTLLIAVYVRLRQGVLPKRAIFRRIRGPGT